MSAQGVASDGCSFALSVANTSSSPTWVPPETVEVVVKWGKPGTEMSALATIDRGPRRLVMVLDNSKFVNDDLWKLEVTVASALYERAQADSLALYVISDQTESLGFAVPRDVQLNKIREFLSARPVHKKEKRRIYDALLRASDLFGTRQFGDSIFYLGGGIDHTSTNRRGATEDTLITRAVRLFGVLFTGLTSNSPRVPVRALPVDITAVGVMELAERSGGLLEYESTEDARHEFKFSPEILKATWAKASRAYLFSTITYRLDLSNLPQPKKPTELQLSLPASSSTKAEESGLLYPHQKWTCVARAL